MSHFPLRPFVSIDGLSWEGDIYLFSGVTCPKSALITAAFDAWFKVPESAQVPKYSLPSFLNIASMLASEPRSARGPGVLLPRSSLSQSILNISCRSLWSERICSTVGAARERTMGERRNDEMIEPHMMPVQSWVSLTLCAGATNETNILKIVTSMLLTN